MQMGTCVHTPRVEFLFPPLLWNSVMKPHWPLKPDSLGAVTPIARPSGWGI